MSIIELLQTLSIGEVVGFGLMIVGGITLVVAQIMIVVIKLKGDN